MIPAGKIDRGERKWIGSVDFPIPTVSMIFFGMLSGAESPLLAPADEVIR